MNMRANEVDTRKIAKNSFIKNVYGLEQDENYQLSISIIFPCVDMLINPVIFRS
jgi:hypothetical protein